DHGRRRQDVPFTEDVMNRNGHPRWMGKQIERGNLREEVALNDVHVAQGSYGADDAIAADQGEQELSEQVVKLFSVLDCAEVAEEAGPSLERRRIQVRRMVARSPDRSAGAAARSPSPLPSERRGRAAARRSGLTQSENTHDP